MTRTIGFFVRSTLFLLVTSAFSLYYWQKLHYDPYLYDFGWLGGLLSGGLDLHVSAVPYGSFYNVHTSPLLSLLAGIRRLIGVDGALWLCLFCGAIHGLTFEASARLLCSEWGNSMRARFGAQLGAFFAAFSLSVGISLTYPHFEYVAIPFFLFFLSARSQITRYLLLGLIALIREDYAILVGVVLIGDFFLRQRNARSATQLIAGLFIGSYGLTALVLRIAVAGPGSLETSLATHFSLDMLSSNLRLLLSSLSGSLVLYPLALALAFSWSVRGRVHVASISLLGLMTLSVLFAGTPQVGAAEAHYGVPFTFCTLILLLSAETRRRVAYVLIASGVVGFFVLVPWRVRPLLSQEIIPYSMHTSRHSVVLFHLTSGGFVSPDLASLAPNDVSFESVRQLDSRNPAVALWDSEKECLLWNEVGLVESSLVGNSEAVPGQLARAGDQGLSGLGLGLLGECDGLSEISPTVLKNGPNQR